MLLVTDKGKLNVKKAEEFLRNENKFISGILSKVAFPERREFDENESDDENVNHSQSVMKGKKTSRAHSLQELQQRLQAFTTNKKRLSYKEKLEKKGIKNRMKKKNHQDERNAQKKLARVAKLESTSKGQMEVEGIEVSNAEKHTSKPIFNKDDKIVFSKIDFANLGKKKKVKKERDPKKLLKKIEVQKEKIEKLKEEGKTDVAIQIKEKKAWKNALAKAEGQKIKDDPMLLKKSLKKKEQKKQSSKKKWEQRIKNVEKAKEEKQQKRMENIRKKKKEKKTKKIKKAVQKGKVIPGY